MTRKPLPIWRETLETATFFVLFIVLWVCAKTGAESLADQFRETSMEVETVFELVAVSTTLIFFTLSIQGCKERWRWVDKWSKKRPLSKHN